jgi:tetratricopeptide (TPR) repeat protein
MKKPQKKQILFTIIITVVIGVSALAAVLFSQYQSSIQPVETKAPALSPKKAVIEQKADDAAKKAYEGDVAGGVAELDQAVAATNDSTEKYTLYSHKATLLYNSQDLAGALAAALKAYEYKQSSDSAALVGQFSRESGNTAQAIEYYKKAVQNVNKTDPYSNEDIKYYNSIIKELGGN